MPNREMVRHAWGDRMRSFVTEAGIEVSTANGTVDPRKDAATGTGRGLTVDSATGGIMCDIGQGTAAAPIL